MIYGRLLDKLFSLVNFALIEINKMDKPENKKPGPVLKAICARCKTNKWCVDFKGGCIAKINSDSICLFCELTEKFEKQEKKIASQEKEIMELKKEIVDLRKEKGSAEEDRGNKEISTLKDAVRELINNSAETGQGLVEVRKELARLKTDRVEKPSLRTRNDFGSDGFLKAKGRMVAKPKKSLGKETVIATSNSFSLLAEEEEETFLIGDSMVREQGRCFGMGNKGKRKVRSFPGASARKVVEEVKKVEVKSKKSTVIVHTGSNDLYLRNKKVGQTEPIIDELTKVVDAIASKTENGMIVGVFPRLNASHYALSKAIRINDRISAVCHQKGVRFVNIWDTFVGNRDLFRRDGVHLNERGMRVLGDLLHRNVFSQIKSTPNSNGQGISGKYMQQGFGNRQQGNG